MSRIIRKISGILLACMSVVNVSYTFAATGRILDGIEAEQADQKTLIAEANIFNSIGMGIALSLAQCEDQEQCQVVNANELEQLLGTLNERIDDLIRRQQGGDSDYDELLSLYVDQRENYLRYQDQLEGLSVIPEAVDETAQDDSLDSQAFGTDDQEEGIDLSIFEDVGEGLGSEEKFEDDFDPEAVK